MRNSKLDIMKGIAIILMVLGHSGFCFTSFINLFHITVFFMMSGYFFCSQKESGFGELCHYVWRKVKGIWLPVFIWSTVFLCSNNFLINIGVYTNQPQKILGKEVVPHTYMSVSETIREIIKALFMVARTELGGAFWFLTVLFGVTLLCIVIEYTLSKLIVNEKIKDIVHGVIAAVLCLMGWLCNFFEISHLTIPVIFSCYILYFFGHMIRKYIPQKTIHPLCAFFAFSVLVIVYMLGGRYSIGNNKYINPICMLLTTFSGWILLSWFAGVLEKKKITLLIKIVGQNTMPIVIHHFWCFKLVHLVQIWIYKYPRTYLAAFPYLNRDGLWWICYTIVGVVFPVLLYISVRKIIHIRKEER